MDSTATPLGGDVHLLDTRMGGYDGITAAFPRAEIVVHERGARHLVDPSRLLASARRVYGDVLDSVFGELLSTPAERVRALGDTGEIDLGDGRRLTSTYSPGHASHHVGLLDSATGDLYVGDAAGIYVPEADLVRPATPPPEFDLDLSLASLATFRDLAPERLLFSHYGPAADVQDVLGRSAEELELWVELARGCRNAELDLDHAVAAVQEKTRERYAALDTDTTGKWQALNSDAANLTGILRWLDTVEKRDGEPLASTPPPLAADPT